MCLTEEVVARFPSGATFVEIGCWLGRSVVHLARTVQESGKSIRIVAVDSWNGEPFDGLNLTAAEMAKEGRTLWERFNDNLARHGVAHIVQPMRMLSLPAAATFPRASADYVFIDADHSYEAIAADIAAWLPVVKPGGILAGHDLDREPVARAVAEALGNHRRTKAQNSWIYDVPGG